jgi:YHS domain-containing protein
MSGFLPATGGSAVRSIPLMLLVSAFLAANVGAQEADPPSARTAAPDAYNLGKAGLALDGYDPVAYFPEGGVNPQRGTAEWTETHEGVAYRFASEEHLELFRAAPARFQPAYGGWCAFAMAKGKTVSVDPTSFRIHRGRLFLFSKSFLSDARDDWLEDEPKLMKLADADWTKRTGEEPPLLARDTSRMNLDARMVALAGRDPVAYFPEGGGKPVKGKDELRLVHEGVVYLFATQANRKRVAKDPAPYEPAYGGWCAWAVAADSSFVEVDPASFLIREDGLHLFYDGFFADTRASWRKDDAGSSRKAVANWARIVELDKRP